VATQHAVDEADIRQQLDKLIEAIRAMDLEGLKPIYASGIVSFDVGPPLQRVGVEGKSQNWAEAFTVSSLRSILRFATSRSPRAVMSHSGMASIGSVAR
jgi:ketosteroid isomerase-like protein